MERLLLGHRHCSSCQGKLLGRPSRFGVVFCCDTAGCTSRDRAVAGATPRRGGATPALVSVPRCLEWWREALQTTHFVLWATHRMDVQCAGSVVQMAGYDTYYPSNCTQASQEGASDDVAMLLDASVVVSPIPRVVVPSSSASMWLMAVPRVRVMLLVERGLIVVTAPDVARILHALPQAVAAQLRVVVSASHSSTATLCSGALIAAPLESTTGQSDFGAALHAPIALEPVLVHEIVVLLMGGLLPSDWVLDGAPLSTRHWAELGGHSMGRHVVGAPSSYLASIEPTLYKALHRHQRDGVIAALQRNGRILFGDDMGVGKTLEAIATIQALGSYPCLIVCPAGLRYLWTEAVERWWPSLPLEEIHVVRGADDMLPRQAPAADGVNGSLPPGGTPKIVVCSYHMVAALQEDMARRPWSCLVLDESHMLRPSVDGPSGDAVYTTVLCDIGRRARHCVMLPGTPSLTSPFGLFLQIDTLLPGIVGATRHDFALDYCRVTLDPHVKVGPCDRVEELREVLFKYVMIRRLKSEVLEDLPPKKRVIVRLARASSWDDGGASSDDDDGGNGYDAPPQPSPSASSTTTNFSARYAAAWKRRHSPLAAFVRALVRKHAASGCKLVVFAHHVALLQFMDRVVRAELQDSHHCRDDSRAAHCRGHSHIYLDGSVAPEARPGLVHSFQTDPCCLVAIVGVTAAAVGISLAAASTCVFAELPPDAAWLQQAEDRLHRPDTQLRSRVATAVTSYIVVDPLCSLDTEMLRVLHASFHATRDVMDGCDNQRVFVDPSDEGATSLVSVAAVGTSPQRAPRGPPMGVNDVVDPACFGRCLTQLPCIAQCVNPLVDVVFRVSPHTHRLHMALLDPAATSPAGGHYDVASHRRQLGSMPLDEARWEAQAATTLGDTDVVVVALRAWFGAWDGWSLFSRQRWVASKQWLSVAGMRQGWRPAATGKRQRHSGGGRVAAPLASYTEHDGSNDCTSVDAGAIADPTPAVEDAHARQDSSRCSPRLMPPRYAPRWCGEVSHDAGGAPDAGGAGSRALYGPWMVWRVSYTARSSVDYPGPLRAVASECGTMDLSHDYVLGCVQCAQSLAPLVVCVPGSVLHLPVGRSDAAMFCGGACRRLYFMLRSGASLRTALHRMDRGCCTLCGVDCDALLTILRATPSVAERREVVKRLHPAMLIETPRQAERLLANPTPGLCWHADHMIPVAHGGGCATEDNVQTICVVCHAQKTLLERQTGAAVDGWGASSAGLHPAASAVARPITGTPLPTSSGDAAPTTTTTVQLAARKMLMPSMAHRRRVA